MAKPIVAAELLLKELNASVRLVVVLEQLGGIKARENQSATPAETAERTGSLH